MIELFGNLNKRTETALTRRGFRPRKGGFRTGLIKINIKN